MPELPDLQALLMDYEEEFEAFDNDYKTGGIYHKAFTANKGILEYAIKQKQPNRYLQKLYRLLWKGLLPDIKSPNNYHNSFEILFKEDNGVDFIKKYKIGNKRILDRLENEPGHKHYFGNFLHVSTLFCVAFSCRFIGYKKNVRLWKGRRKKKDTKEYYLFYNRSHVQKMDTGIGRVTLNGQRATVYYYYQPTSSKRKFDTLKTEGDVCYHPDASVLVLKNVTDTDTSPCYNSSAPVESYYVIKQFKKEHEKILLGIVLTWNRDKSYPVSSAVILVDKAYYDSKYRSGSEFAFSIETFVRSKQILPRLFYFLYHQSISLESVIEKRKIPAKDKLYTPFETFDDVPFYRSEANNLELVAGRYKGLSVIPVKGDFMPVISELIIRKTGIVELHTTPRQEEMKKYLSETEENGVPFTENSGRDKQTSYENKGFVKLVEITNEVNGRIYISLGYNFAEHYNHLNHFLEFELKNRKEAPKFLKGVFAGKSLVTNEPVASTVIFERVDENTPAGIDKFKVNPDDDSDRSKLYELYSHHRSLFDIYYKETDKYTNNKAVQLLREILPLNHGAGSSTKQVKQYDIFISIPLNSAHSKVEYYRNTKLVDRLKTVLQKKFNITSDRIYCSCFNGNKIIPYKDYVIKSNISTYIEVSLDKLEGVHTLIMVYPKKVNQKQTTISSSLVEAGFALGLKKKIILLYDESEEKNLPVSLSKLQPITKFTFETAEANPFEKIFNSKTQYERLSKALQGV